MGLCAEVLADRLVAVVNGLALHYHAHSAAVGRIVHAAVLILSIFPYLTAVQAYFSCLAGSADNALAKYSLAHLGKQCGYFNMHIYAPL